MSAPLETRTIAMTPEQWRNMEIDLAEKVRDAQADVEEARKMAFPQGHDLALADVAYFTAALSAIKGAQA